MLGRSKRGKSCHPICTISNRRCRPISTGLYEGDTDKLGSVFHDVAHLFGVADGKLDRLSREQWFDVVKSRKSPQSRT